MSTVERGVGFHFHFCVDFSPVKILPVGGGPVEVTQCGTKQDVYPVTISQSDEPHAKGTISLVTTFEKTNMLYGEITVPEGAKVSVSALGIVKPIEIDVLKKGDNVVIHDPNKKPDFPSVLMGTSLKTAQGFPKNAPQFVVWKTKNR